MSAIANAFFGRYSTIFIAKNGVKFELFTYRDSSGKEQNSISLKVEVYGELVSSKRSDLQNDIIEKVSILSMRDDHIELRLSLSQDYLLQFASDLFRIIPCPEKVKDALYIDDDNSIYFEGIMKVVEGSDLTMIRKGDLLDVQQSKGVFDHNITHVVVDSAVNEANMVRVRFYIDPKYSVMISKGTLVGTIDKTVIFTTLSNSHLKPGPAVNTPDSFWSIDDVGLENICLKITGKSVIKTVPLSQKWIKEHECFTHKELPLWIDVSAQADIPCWSGRSFAPGEVNTVIELEKIAIHLDTISPVENFYSTS